MIEVRAYHNAFSGTVDLIIIIENDEGIRCVGRVVAGEPVQQAILTMPSVSMSAGAGQTLANSLWDAGVKPTQSQSSVGMADAQNAHLQDMRAIAFDRLKVERP